MSLCLIKHNDNLSKISFPLKIYKNKLLYFDWLNNKCTFGVILYELIIYYYKKKLEIVKAKNKH